MKRLFIGLAATLALLAMPGCSKSEKNYEAIYYILQTGSENVITNNDEGDHYKTMIEENLKAWKAATIITWRVNFGTSYSKADVDTKDNEAIAYFNERIDAFNDWVKAVKKDMKDSGSPAIVHSAWHISLCRDRSSNTLVPSVDIYLDHE